MELTNDKAKEDFEIIKSTIEQADKKQNDMSGLLLRYGLVQLLLFILFQLFFVSVAMRIENLWPIVVFRALELLSYIYITIIYFKVYRNVRMSSNKYFLGFLVTFGVVAVIYPYINIMLNIVSFWVNVSMESSMRLQNYNSLLSIILFCVCFIVCGFITNKKIFVAISVLILTLYLTMDILDIFLYYAEIEIGNVGIGASGILKYVCTTLGYITLSFILKRRKNNGY